MGINWTDVVVALIGVLGTILSGVVTLAWNRYIKPWLAEKRLTDAAGVVVNAIEALYREYNGKEKLELAFERLFDMGVCKNLDTKRVREAIEAAYMQMHIAQVAAWMKENQQKGIEE